MQESTAHTFAISSACPIQVYAHLCRLDRSILIPTQISTMPMHARKDSAVVLCRCAIMLKLSPHTCVAATEHLAITFAHMSPPIFGATSKLREAITSFSVLTLSPQYPFAVDASVARLHVALLVLDESAKVEVCILCSRYQLCIDCLSALLNEGLEVGHILLQSWDAPCLSQEVVKVVFCEGIEEGVKYLRCDSERCSWKSSTKGSESPSQYAFLLKTRSKRPKQCARSFACSIWGVAGGHHPCQHFQKLIGRSTAFTMNLYQ
mmetsp:Transcript_29158/g.75029  ORF Transcript_29158/g.75029 Transcript_29158/m.75029 type:complete len:263 (-) Transcript_29158:1449-2237(-)